jgi:NAD(P)-dependent dehydrogenase (short-subunit alcohol dehydrogenase family)
VANSHHNIQKDQNVWKPIAETDVATYDRIMEINARGMLLCCKAEAAVLRKQSPKTFTGRNGTRDIGRGAIVNIASANAFVGLPGKVSYAMSKHAAMGLIKMVGMWFNPILPPLSSLFESYHLHTLADSRHIKG